MVPYQYLSCTVLVLEYHIGNEVTKKEKEEEEEEKDDEEEEEKRKKKTNPLRALPPREYENKWHACTGSQNIEKWKGKLLRGVHGNSND